MADNNEMEPELEDDINELLALLSSEDEAEEDSQEEFSDDSEESESGIQEDLLTEQPEVSLFSEDDSDSIFADSPEEEQSETQTSQEGEKQASTEVTSVDDVFEDALSAVEYSENEQNAGDDVMALEVFGEEEQPSEEEQPVRVKKTRKKKERPPKQKSEESIMKKLFGNVITEQTAEEEARERELEQASAQERKEAKEEKKKQQAQQKAEQAEIKKAEKEKKAAANAEKKLAKAAAKEEKKRQRAELEATEVVGKINPVGATIVMVFFAIICVSVILGTQLFSRSHAVKSAENNFENKDYQSAYDSIAGVEVSESAKEMADKVRICMQLQKQINSYDNYYKMRMYLEALDSLVKGIRSYDTNQAKAEEYEIVSQYNELESQIASALYSEFGVTETEARSIISAETQEEYTARLEQIIRQWEQKSEEDKK